MVWVSKASMNHQQRKVQIGPSGDAYEHQADRVSADVASGRSIAPSAISPIGSLPSPVGQRADAAPAPEKKPEKKKDEKPPSAVQKANAPAEKKPDEKKKDDKKAAPAVQKADKPGEKEKKKEEQPKTPAPVQKADKAAEKTPDEKKKDDKKTAAPAVQRPATAARGTASRRRRTRIASTVTTSIASSVKGSR